MAGLGAVMLSAAATMGAVYHSSETELGRPYWAGVSAALGISQHALVIGCVVLVFVFFVSIPPYLMLRDLKADRSGESRLGFIGIFAMGAACIFSVLYWTYVLVTSTTITAFFR